ncbi:hypothetical protein OA006_01550 [Prochlorococcus sp. AH-736-D21]|nr:hypothetical protein [Prochlorococcus sp. AH-736-D21]
MIGGAESIRDIQEAKNLFTNSFEFSLIESEFALTKIFSALEKVFYDNPSFLFNAYLFINISTPDGLNLIRNIENFDFPNFLNRDLIIFNFDRRLIVKNTKKIKGYNFEYIKYEKEFNPIIDLLIKKLNKNKLNACMSGDIKKRSLIEFSKNYLLPKFIKTGLFTLDIKEKDKENTINFEEIFFYQNLEAKLLEVLKNALFYRSNYVSKRLDHLQNYLKDN